MTWYSPAAIPRQTWLVDFAERTRNGAEWILPSTTAQGSIIGAPRNKQRQKTGVMHGGRGFDADTCPHEEFEQQGETCQRHTNPSCTFHLHDMVANNHPIQVGMGKRPAWKHNSFLYVYINIYHLKWQRWSTKHQRQLSQLVYSSKRW